MNFAFLLPMPVEKSPFYLWDVFLTIGLIFLAGALVGVVLAVMRRKKKPFTFLGSFWLIFASGVAMVTLVIVLEAFQVPTGFRLP